MRSSGLLWMVALALLFASASAFVFTENFESWGCGGPSSPQSVFQGEGSVIGSLFTWGFGCEDPWPLFCVVFPLHSRGGRTLVLTGGSVQFTFPAVQEYFSGYFGATCGSTISLYFYQNGLQVYGENITPGQTGFLQFFEFTACFDQLVIVGDFALLDDLTVKRTPPTIECPVYLPKQIFERFENFNCGKQTSPISIFNNRARLFDTHPYIWGPCAKWSYCYAAGQTFNGIGLGYGHDTDDGSAVTISWGLSVYGFGGQFSACQSSCCNGRINFQYFDGTKLVATEDFAPGLTGGAFRSYFHQDTFDRVVITGSYWAMDEIYFIDKDDVVVATDPDSCKALVDFHVQAIDVCSLSSITYTSPPDVFYDPGQYQITATATDRSGVSTCDFLLIVKDKEDPKITCPGDITVFADPTVCTKTVTYTPTATDNCGSGVPPTLTVTPLSGSVFQGGSTSVFVTATDGSGNTALCDFTVTVVDNQNPTITCPAPITLTVSDERCGSVVTWPAPTVADNCGAPSVLATFNSGFFFPIGATVNTLTAVDRFGNTASCTFTITIIDGSKLCFCGNGKVDPSNGEACEVNQLGSATCQSYLVGGVPVYPDGGVLDCTNCQYDYSRCAVCGDGRIDGAEECDGSNLNSQTCATKGFTTGTLSCSNQCRFVTSQCSTCGNGVPEGAEACDGSQFNGKTCVDFFGQTATGTLSCKSDCTIDTQNCNGGPKVTAPTAGQILYLTRGIQISATGFINDRKAVISLTDGVSTQTFPEVTLTLPAGSLSVTLFPNTLRPTTTWKATVKGSTTQFKAFSPIFTVKTS